MTLELKHLAPYLPYGLKYISPAQKAESIIHFSKEETVETMNVISMLGMLNIEKRYTPILRPLSDLTKEIEVNGRKVIPFEEIAKIEAPNIVGAVDKLRNITVFNRGLSFSSCQQGVLYKYEGVLIEITRFKDCIFHKKVVEGNNSWVFSYFHNYPSIMELIYSLRFDAFGLIEKGLAIDINTLPNKAS